MTQFVFAMLNREGRCDRPNTSARQDRHRQFHGVWQLNGHGIANPNTGGLKGMSNTVDGSVDLSPREALGRSGKEGVSVGRIDEGFVLTALCHRKL